MYTIAERLQETQKRIQLTAQQYGRDKKNITLLAVSKTKPPSMILQAYQAGIVNFGENYVQEALDKINELKQHPLSWHFIGPLQSNKTRQVAEQFSWIHTVDRIKIAERLSQQRPEGLPDLNVCIQLNISNEDTKSGTVPSALAELAQCIDGLPKLRLRGLMTIPAPSNNFNEQRQACAKMNVLFKQLKLRHAKIDTLSMGMSNDLEAAIAEGSTMVRIGTAIFGSRI